MHPQDISSYNNIFYNELYKKINRGDIHFEILDSFEQFYRISIKAIEFFNNSEEYEKSLLINNNILNLTETIPKNLDEAIEDLYKKCKVRLKEFESNLRKTNAFSLAIYLHETLGLHIIDRWLLNVDGTTLREYYKETYSKTNPDEIANHILINFIEILKLKIE